MRRFMVFMALLLALAQWPLVTQAQTDCPVTRLTVGGQGQVAPGTANRLRSAPSTSGEQVGQIPGGSIFEVLEGPECAGGFLWWRVQYENVTGWTVEGNASEYFVDPVVPADEPTPTATAPAPITECALPTQLAVGRAGRTTSNTPSRLRDNPGGAQIGQIDPLDTFQILEGPTCVDGINWWRVEVNGVVGWTAEGMDGTYFIEMLEIVATPTPAYIGLTEPRSIAWNADGSLVAVGAADGLYLYDTADWSQPPVAHLTEFEIDNLAFHPTDPNVLALRQDDGENYAAYLFDVEADATTTQLTFERPIGIVNSLMFTADGTQLALNNVGNLTLLDVATDETSYSLRLDDYTDGAVAYMGAARIAVSPAGELMGAYDGRVLVVPVGGSVNQVVELDRDVIDASVVALEFNPEGTQIIAGDVDGNLQMWDVETQARTSFIRGARSTTSNTIHALAFHPDGRTLVTAEGDPNGVVRVFNAVTLTQVAAYDAGPATEQAWDLAFSPDGTLLAVIVDDTVRVLETESYTEVAQLVLQRN